MASKPSKDGAVKMTTKSLKIMASNTGVTLMEPLPIQMATSFQLEAWLLLEGTSGPSSTSHSLTEELLTTSTTAVKFRLPREELSRKTVAREHFLRTSSLILIKTLRKVALFTECTQTEKSPSLI